ncbi:MAG: hypothetical protein ACJZ3C_01585 [Pelagibacteraceae bacterium]
MNKLLWKPSEEKIKGSLLEKFVNSLNIEKDRNFNNLWRWSNKEPEKFWSKLWDFSEIVGHKGEKILKKDKTFNKNTFFPDSKINYAENLLKKKNNELAINFLSENGFEESITWQQLYDKVCKLSYFFKKIGIKKK